MTNLLRSKTATEYRSQHRQRETGVTTDWKETADGVYKATYTAYTKGSGLTAKPLMQN